MSILCGGQNPPEAITLATLKDAMGTAAGATLLKDAPSSGWLQRGQVGMGIRPHWDATPPAWGALLTDYIGSGAPVAGEPGLFPGDGTYGAIVGFFEDFVPWYVAWPGVNNTNTNAIVEVVELHAYLLNSVDWTWEKLGNANGQQNAGARWGSTVNETSPGAATAVRLQGRRAGYKFNDSGTMRYVHGYSNATFSANAANVAAIVCTAKIRIVPPFGQTLDGVVEYYANVGIDVLPKNLTMSTSVAGWDGYGANTTPLAGPGYTCNCGVSKLHLLTSDGTWTRVSCASLSEGNQNAVRSYVGNRYASDAVFEAHPLYTQQVAAL
jgi:hypothetical protein